MLRDPSALLQRGRDAAENLMNDTCIVTRASEAGREFDPQTMQYNLPDRVQVYTGKCRIQIRPSVAGSSDTSSGERLGTVQDSELQLPIEGTSDISVNDVVEILTADKDPSLVGRQYTVKTRHEKSQATARRLRLQEGTS